MSRLLLFLLLCLPWRHAEAKPLVADLSEYRIAIDTGFRGAQLLLFGARGDAGDVVVVIRGPDKSFTVRRKERVGGVWANTDAVTFARLPNFYAVASSRPLAEIQSPALMRALGIGERDLPFVPAAAPPSDVASFEDALLRHQHRRGHYAEGQGQIHFLEESLFRANVPFPNTLLRGTYTAEVYLLSDGQLAGFQTIPLHVEKTGFDALVTEFAHRYGALYGVAAVVFAAGAGWLASNVFKRLG